jgi:hypothetical protein
MSLISDYSRTWAMRFLRETFVEYQKGKESQSEDQSRTFMTTAIRKAQLALEYAFESPEYFELIIADMTQNQPTSQNPKLKLLSTLTSITQAFSEPQMTLDRELILKITREVVQGVSAIIEEMTSERIAYSELN